MGTHNHVAVNVRFHQANLQFCEAFRTEFGGSVIQNRSSYCWSVQGRRAKHFLELIEPYAQHKRMQAQIALKYFGNYDDKVIKEVHALNSVNNKAAFNRF